MIESLALASTYDVASALRTDRRLANTLMRSGFLGPLYRSRGSELVEASHVVEFARRRPVTTIPQPTLVVRLNHALLDASMDEEKVETILSGPWELRDREVPPRVLIATISTFVLKVRSIERLERISSRDVRLHLGEASTRSHSAYDHRRIPGIPGFRILYLDDTATLKRLRG